MPFYNTASTSASLGISQKWLDNLLSHNKIDGVEQTRQGVSRRLSIEAIVIIAVTHRLVKAANIPVGQAIELAERLIVSPSHSVIIADDIMISINRGQLEKSILEGLERAIEVTPLPARGRPLSAGGENKQGAS
jgi:hypothetical protein